MKTISIDNDIYEYIASNTKEIGEPASKILRRLLHLEIENVSAQNNAIENELVIALEGKNLKVKSAVDKLLIILSEAYKINKDTFNKVLLIQGRGRKYFAETRSEITESGNSTQPKLIPGSPYWVMTNSPTNDKRKLCKKVLEVIGYPSEIAWHVANMITK